MGYDPIAVIQEEDATVRPSHLPESGQSSLNSMGDSTVNCHEGPPVGRLLVNAANSLQLLFNEKRHNVSQIDRGLFAIGKAG